jgi:hypothetical protein
MNPPKVASVLGADPGLQGAVVRLILGRPLRIEFVRIDRLPKDPPMLVRALGSIVREWEQDGPVVGVGLEEPFAMPGKKGQGHMLSYGRRFGHLETALGLSASQVTLYGPSQWQPKIMPTRRQGRTAKQAAAWAFDRLFRLGVSARPHEGVIDAALIALVEAMRIQAIAPVVLDWETFFREVAAPPKKETSK